MFKFTPEAQARIAAHREWEQKKRGEMAALNDESLVATAKLYMANMRPMGFAPGEPVYDATMWHIILPELLKRIGK